MTKKRREPRFIPPPLNPRDFIDPLRRKRQKRTERHKSATALNQLARYFTE